MRNDNTQVSQWGYDEHPSTELLRQYEEGVLPPSSRHELERHLLDCEMCEDILSGMALADRSSTRQARDRIWQRLGARLRKSRRRPATLPGLGDWRVVLGVLMMFCSLGLVLFYYYTRSQEHKKAAMQAGEMLPPTPEELLARTIDSALVLDIPAPPHTATQMLSEHKAPANSDPIVLRGRLLSDTGEPVLNAGIRLKGSSRSTHTDAAGNFRLPADVKPVVLEIRAAGYPAQEFEVGVKETTITIRLTPLSQNH